MEAKTRRKNWGHWGPSPTEELVERGEDDFRQAKRARLSVCCIG